MSILEEANRIVTEREHAYHQVIADMYFMAIADHDQDFAAQIWVEALATDSFHLSLLLHQASQQANQIIQPPRTRRARPTVFRRRRFSFAHRPLLPFRQRFYGN